MSERLTWQEIAERYPDQWVGLTEVVFKPDNDATIESAVVTYTGITKSELTAMMLDGLCIGRYTTPNNIISLGGILELF